MIYWVLFIALEVFRNYYMIEVKKTKPVYLQSFIFRGMAAIVHGGLIMDVRNVSEWWPVLIFQVLSFWVLFDIGLNVSRKKHPFYYNKSGWIEQTLGKSQMAYYIVKLIAVLILIDLL